MEALKGTADKIRDVTGAVEKLTASQSGLKGIIGLFSDFGAQLRGVQKDLSTSMLDELDKKIGKLNESLKTTGGNISRLREQISSAEARGDTDAAAQMRQQLKVEQNLMLGTQGVLADAKIAQFMRSPIIDGMPGPVNSLLGSPNLAGLMGRIPMGVGMAFAGNALFERGRDFLSTIEESGARTERAQFDQEMSILQQAMGGRVGRYTMLREGRGWEYKTMMGETTRSTRSALDIMMNLTGYKTFEEQDVERRERAAQLDRPEQTLRDMITGAAVNRTRAFDFMARRTGNRAIDEMLLNITGGFFGRPGTHATTEDAIPIARMLERYQMSDETMRGMAGRVRPSGTITDADLIRDAGFAFIARNRLGLSEGGLESMIRYGRFVGSSKANTDMVLAMNRNMSYTDESGNVKMGFQTMDARQARSEFIAEHTKGYFTGVSAEEVTRMSGNVLETLQRGGTRMPEVMQQQFSQNIQQLMQGSMGTNQTMMGMGIEVALRQLGVTNAFVIQSVMSLMQQGKTDTAVDIVVRATGKSDREVRNVLRVPVKQALDTLGEIIGKDKDVAAMRAAGVSPELTAMAGIKMGVGTEGAMQDIMAQVDPFAKRVGRELTKGELTRVTEGDVLKEGEADLENKLLQLHKDMATDQGKLVISSLVKATADGYRDLGNKLMPIFEKMVSEKQETETKTAGPPAPQNVIDRTRNQQLHDQKMKESRLKPKY